MNDANPSGADFFRRLSRIQAKASATTSRREQFSFEDFKGRTIPLAIMGYFRGRLQNRLYDLVVREFLKQEAEGRLTKAEVARRIGRRPEVISRWLGAPGNWTLDTVSDLMLAMGAELEFSVVALPDARTKRSPTRRRKRPTHPSSSLEVHPARMEAK